MYGNWKKWCSIAFLQRYMDYDVPEKQIRNLKHWWPRPHLFYNTFKLDLCVVRKAIQNFPESHICGCYGLDEFILQTTHVMKCGGYVGLLLVRPPSPYLSVSLFASFILSLLTNTAPIPCSITFTFCLSTAAPDYLQYLYLHRTTATSDAWLWIVLRTEVSPIPFLYLLTVYLLYL